LIEINKEEFQKEKMCQDRKFRKKQKTATKLFLAKHVNMKTYNQMSLLVSTSSR